MNQPTPAPSLWQRSTTRRVLKWLCSWRGVGTTAVVFASLVTLVALFYAVENWRGQRAWNRCRRELEAQGEKLDFRAFIPPPVPDDQNFAAAPIFAHLFDRPPPGVPEESGAQLDARLRRIRVDLQGAQGQKAPQFALVDSGSLIDLAQWQRFFAGNTNYPQPAAPQSAAQDVLLALSGFDVELTELEQAAARPKCRWPVDYTVGNPIAIRLPHLTRLRDLAQVPLLRAAAHLQTRQSAKALGDLKLILRLADSLEGEPFLISFLVRRRLVGDMVAGAREGLVRHAWTDAQLAEIERHLAGVDLLGAHQAAMRGERAMSLACVDYVRRGSRADKLREFFDTQGDLGEAMLAHCMPSGWYYRNQATIARLYQQHIIPGVDPSTRQISPKLLSGADADVRGRAGGPLAQLLAIRTRFFADLLMPAIAPAALKTAQTQTWVDQARLACALERYRLAKGQFPDTLEALLPRFVDKLPQDLVSGEPMKYRRDADGGCLLYAVGWNGKDEGGQTVRPASRSKSPDPAQGDWVWTGPPRN